MTPADLADVGGHAYTYLVNGKTPAGNWTGLFAPGERVRLRIINGSSMTTFDVRIPGLTMTVVAADGQYVRPVDVEEFRIGAAEVLDVLVEPRGADAFTLFAQSLDRSGYARATLAVRDGLEARRCRRSIRRSTCRWRTWGTRATRCRRRAVRARARRPRRRLRGARGP